LGLVLCCLCLPAAAQQPLGFASIQKAFFREDFQAVTQHAPQFLQTAPASEERAQVALWFGLSLHQLGKTQEALQQLERLAQQLEPDSFLWPEVLFWQAELARFSADFVQARNAYQRVIERFPYTPWATYARLGIGLVFVHYEQYDAAGRYFRGVVQEQEYTAAGRQAKLFAGFCALKEGVNWEAVRYLSALRESSSDPVLNARAALYLGEAYTQMGKPAEARRFYQETIALAPTSEWAALSEFALGWVAYREDACGEAVQQFETYLDAGHTQHRPEALFAKAECLLRHDNQAEAAALLDQLIVEHPTHPLSQEAGLFRVDQLMRQGAVQAAEQLISQLNQAVVDPTLRRKVALQRGFLAVEAGRLQEAREWLQQALEAASPVVQQAAQNALGDIAVWQGDAQQAEQRYSASLALNAVPSETTHARLQLARLLLDQQAYERFDSLLEDAAAADAGAVNEIKLLHAVRFIHAGAMGEARSALDTLYAQAGATALGGRVAYFLALIAYEEERWEEAAALAGQAVAWAPGSEEVLDAQVILAELLVRAGRRAEALAYLWKEYHEAPVNRRMRVRMAQYFADFAQQQGQLVDAIAWYEAVLELAAENSGAALYAQASCYERGGDLELALRRYRALEQPPWQVRGLFAVAKLYEFQHAWAEAIAVYEQLLALQVPESRFVSERIEALRLELDGKRDV
jgi:tetratricopeptide (TPR) repeat protein